MPPLECSCHSRLWIRPSLERLGLSTLGSIAVRKLAITLTKIEKSNFLVLIQFCNMLLREGFRQQYQSLLRYHFVKEDFNKGL